MFSVVSLRRTPSRLSHHRVVIGPAIIDSFQIICHASWCVCHRVAPCASQRSGEFPLRDLDLHVTDGVNGLSAHEHDGGDGDAGTGVRVVMGEMGDPRNGAELVIDVTLLDAVDEDTGSFFAAVGSVQKVI